MPLPADGTPSLPQDQNGLSHEGVWDSTLNGGSGGYKRIAGVTKDGQSAYLVATRKDGSDIGPITAADGALATMGAKGDAAWDGAAPSPSAISIWKRLIGLLPAVLGAHGAMSVEGVASGTAVAVTAGDGLLAIRPTRGLYTNRSGTIASGGNSQPLMGANASRNHWFLQNTSNADLWFNYSAAATLGSPSIQVVAGAVYESPAHFVSTEAITIIGATTGQTFTAKEA